MEKALMDDFVEAMENSGNGEIVEKKIFLADLVESFDTMMREYDHGSADRSDLFGGMVGDKELRKLQFDVLLDALLYAAYDLDNNKKFQE